MNPQLTGDLATSTIRDFQRLARERRAHADQPEPPAAVGGRHRSPLRRRLGFTLVEAGLALLTEADRGYLPS